MRLGLSRVRAEGQRLGRPRLDLSEHEIAGVEGLSMREAALGTRAFSSSTPVTAPSPPSSSGPKGDQGVGTRRWSSSNQLRTVAGAHG